jgi:hypothetical protein
MRERRVAYRVVVGKPEAKRPLGRSRRRWKAIKMHRQEVGWEGMNWIDLAQDNNRWQVSGSECGNEPWGCIKCGEFLAWLRTC